MTIMKAHGGIEPQTTCVAWITRLWSGFRNCYPLTVPPWRNANPTRPNKISSTNLYELININIK